MSTCGADLAAGIPPVDAFDGSAVLDAQLLDAVDDTRPVRIQQALRHAGAGKSFDVEGFQGDGLVLARHYWRAQRLWSPSYYAGTNGGAPLDTLKRYIENQNRPERFTTALKDGVPSLKNDGSQTHNVKTGLTEPIFLDIATNRKNGYFQ